MPDKDKSIVEEMPNPLAGIPLHLLEAKTGGEFAVQYGFVKELNELKNSAHAFYDTMWDTAIAIGKAEGMATISAEVQDRIRALEIGRDSWKESAENVSKAHDEVVRERNEFRKDRDHLKNELELANQAGMEAQLELNDAKEDLAAANNRAERLEELSSNSLTHVLDARRRLARALGFPEDWVFVHG